MSGNARVLDAGCGTGLPTAGMLASAGCQVLGVDISETMLALARDNVPGARFERRNLAEVSTADGPFDAIAAFFSLLMLPRAEVESTLRAWTALVRPGGYLVLSMVEGDLDYAEIPFLGQTERKPETFDFLDFNYYGVSRNNAALSVFRLRITQM